MKTSLSRLAAVSIIVLACSIPTVCGEIHDTANKEDSSQKLINQALVYNSPIHKAAEEGNLQKVKMLIKNNPMLVFSED
jgi:hypothetical protein